MTWRLPPASCQISHAIHGAECQFTTLGLRACVAHVIEQPLQLGAGEIRIYEQPGLRLNGLRPALRAQGCAQGLLAAILPDNGVVDGLPGLAIPQHGGFTLIGNANGTDVLGRQARFLKSFASSGKLCIPDFDRIVLDPARARIDLPKLSLRKRNDVASRIENNAA